MDNNNDKFMKWLFSNVSFFESLSKEEINYIKEKYDNVNKLLDIETNTLNMAQHHNKSGIDYSTSFEKASQKRVLAQKELKQFVNDLNIKYNVESGDINHIRK